VLSGRHLDDGKGAIGVGLGPEFEVFDDDGGPGDGFSVWVGYRASNLGVNKARKAEGPEGEQAKGGNVSGHWFSVLQKYNAPTGILAESEKQYFVCHSFLVIKP
jgi:hypothetical protein